MTRLAEKIFLEPPSRYQTHMGVVSQGVKTPLLELKQHGELKKGNG
jgi:hypothetical protein